MRQHITHPQCDKRQDYSSLYKVDDTAMFEQRLILLLSRFNKLLHIALAIALVIASLMIVWQFSVEVISAIVHGHFVRGFLQSLGTLFLVWTLSSLISAEISYLQNGIFQVRVFIEVVIITLLRQIIVEPVQVVSAQQNMVESFDPMHYGLILAALLIAGILHWLVGSVSISVSHASAMPDDRITTEKSS